MNNLYLYANSTIQLANSLIMYPHKISHFSVDQFLYCTDKIDYYEKDLFFSYRIYYEDTIRIPGNPIIEEYLRHMQHTEYL